MPSINKIQAEIRKQKPRSAWGLGVKKYAIEMLDDVKDWKGGSFELDTSNYEKYLLNGASNWKEYSWGGSALIYNEDIAKRLSTKSELAATRNGQRKPNAREEWLDTQARALKQADNMIHKAIISANAPKKATVRKVVKKTTKAKARK